MERFWSKVEKTHNCWLWRASTKYGGYGSFYRDGRRCAAHRVAYELLVGPIPEGLELDHLCRNPPCVNPAHLEPVTHQENMRRADIFNRRKTHCAKGHEFTPENTRWRNQGGRTCKECKRQASKGLRDRIKGPPKPREGCNGHAQGGFNRADRLSSERRSEIARMGGRAAALSNAARGEP